MAGPLSSFQVPVENGECKMNRVEEGQGMVEYGLVITLVALAVVASLALLGPAVQGSIRAGIGAFP